MYISNMTLVKIAAIGGIATVSMGMALRHKIDTNIKQTEYYKEALKTVRANRGAVYLLGEPIKEGTINVSDDTNNFIKENKAQFQVPIKGPKQRGTVYIWAGKENDVWNVTRIELGLKNEPNRRLLIKNVTSQ